MAPIQAIWARDNRGVMVRALGAPGDASTHLENRVGEPLANPYLYMASQIHAGLDGIARKLVPPPSADAPYEVSAEPLPKSLAEALAALDDDACFRSGFGTAFVDYLLRIKRAEIARCDAESGGQSGQRRRRHRLGAQRVFRSGLAGMVRRPGFAQKSWPKIALRSCAILIQFCGSDERRKYPFFR